MSGTEEQRSPGAGRNSGQPVELTDDRRVLPEQSVDDTDRGWGERPDSNDERLLAERPPHWD
ncbi:hypothetical protein O7626_38490 [Micromonospora sp. WMMD1102]|uniref:hypothetical protein n=1 Tax=Micromonospora sp. WMMD1102 TaxID=3016105 RepID=UPI002415241D|nr:hypothetical protein [Micromonospora sp. WMMD1102]MDG4791717.1 hypothetical protein [Micromonospora sp. WMMD1102]